MEGYSTIELETLCILAGWFTLENEGLREQKERFIDKLISDFRPTDLRIALLFYIAKLVNPKASIVDIYRTYGGDK